MLLLGLGTALLVTGVGVSSAAARDGVPATTTVACKMSGKVPFNPPISSVSADTQQAFHGKLTVCSGDGVSKGKFRAHLDGDASCEGDVATGTFVVDWDTGGASHGSVTLDMAFLGDGGGTLTGQVLRGLFKGDSVGATLSATKINGDCIHTPVSEAHFRGAAQL